MLVTFWLLGWSRDSQPTEESKWDYQIIQTSQKKAKERYNHLKTTYIDTQADLIKFLFVAQCVIGIVENKYGDFVVLDKCKAIDKKTVIYNSQPGVNIKASVLKGLLDKHIPEYEASQQLYVDLSEAAEEEEHDN